MSNIIELNKKKTINELMQELKDRLEGESILVVVHTKEDNFNTFIDESINDRNLCYAIDCLNERRRMRNNE